jgi:hypothetical protein
MTKSRIDSALDIRSVHEAGHAMAAVRNRVAFSYVSIERDPLPGTGGHIRLWRRGESSPHHYAGTRKVLIFLGNKNRQNRENRDFSWKPIEKPVEFFGHSF